VVRVSKKYDSRHSIKLTPKNWAMLKEVHKTFDIKASFAAVANYLLRIGGEAHMQDRKEADRITQLPPPNFGNARKG